MICGSCSNDLKFISISEVGIHVCKSGCGGLWFNSQELKKVTKQAPSSGQKFLEIETVEGVRVFRDLEHACPRCKTTLLFRHFFSKGFGFEVDQCSKCGGFWFAFDTIEKKDATKWEMIRNAIGEKMVQMDMSHPDVLEAKTNIGHILRFLFPSTKTK